MTFLNQLNDRQREAAETLTGPLLIVAGAGSGKTRTLTYRIANLIQQKKALLWQILAVTFTNKAANEMKQRVKRLIQSEFGEESTQPMIGTFHSICLKILWKHYEKVGRQKSFVIYDTTDTKGIMKRLIKEARIDDEKIKPQLVLGMISKAKNRLQSASQFAGRAGNYFERSIAELYTAYEKRLAENNAVDFDDLIMLTVRLFENHPEVLEEYQERWRYLNVDEYQDTNHAQYTLTKLLASKYRNLCVIGDSDQSIYAFRGADINNILDFEKDYPDAKIIKLEQNYRSTQTILDAADAIIEKNQQRKAKKMWTEQEGGDLIEVIHAESEQEEARTITQEIERLREKSEAQLLDIVILYRTNAQSRLLEEAMLRFGFPYKVIGGVKFYARKEIKDLLAYLRVLVNPSDTDSLLRIINVPSRRIGQTTVQKLQAFALSRSLNLSEVLNHIEMVEAISSRTQTQIKHFWQLFRKWELDRQSKSVSELMRQIVKDINYEGYLKDGTEEGEMRYENILELISVASKYDGLDAEIALISFLEEVALVADVDNLNDSENLVTLMTLHSVKGLEYPYVFIAGCEESIFPHSRSLMDQQEMEEERRLMYVGVTRAMKKLYLLAAKRRMLYGDFQSNRLSRFIEDIPSQLIQSTGMSRSRTVSYSPSEGEVPEPRLQAKQELGEDKFADGDRVVHPSYGEGLVVERRGDLVTVAFDDKLYGLKKFAANIAPIQKVEKGSEDEDLPF